MDDNFIYVLVGAAVISIGTAFYFDSKYNKHELYEAQCEAKGGVYLDRTYSGYKNQTNHKYTCIKKEVVIE